MINPATPDANAETQSVSDLDTFFTLLNGWHKNKVAMLKHMTEVPEGTEVSLDDKQEPTITLTGEVLAGFKLGIELSLMELGTLPFYEEPEVLTPALQSV